MIDIYRYPSVEQWAELARRPQLDTQSLFGTVRSVLDDVRQRGDVAVLEYGARFDGVALDELAVSDQEWAEAPSLIDDDLKAAIRQAKRNIEMFHASQAHESTWVETMPGVRCRQRSVAIERVGLYIPGGSAPLFSTVLMLAVPASIAGCQEIVLCTPPNKEGKVHPAILFAAQVAGVNKLYKIGGIQAIAAMAYGTESVPQVYKIFGPGNQYVTAAKQLIALDGVAIDLPAGPSEASIIADATADPAFIASDFLSQAEHGRDSQSILATDSEELICGVVAELEKQLEVLPRKEITRQALLNSRIILLRDMEEVIAFTNHYAPEHLVVQCNDEMAVADRILHSGSIFVGAYTPVAAGDYASGTNHTLPTAGYAKAYSGVNLDSFVKKITIQTLSAEGIKGLGQTIITMAQNEGLDAHKRSVTIRLEQL